MARTRTPESRASRSSAGQGEISLRARVEQILDLIRPAVQMDGGDVELVDVSAEGVVSVRLHGACVGCPSSRLTLHAGIERQLTDRLPEIKAVQSVA